MFFRNVMFFCYPPELNLSLVDQQLEKAQLQDVGPLEMRSRGFISPFGRESNAALCHRQGEYIWLTLGVEEKVLPTSIVNDLLHRQCVALEHSQGRRPSGRERLKIKDELLHDLLPRALVKHTRTDVMIDTRMGYVAIDTSSNKVAEEVISEIRAILGSFPAMPITAQAMPRAVLTRWIAGEVLPELVELGFECELKDPVDHGAVVRCQQQQLRTDEIDTHLEAGKQVSKLALCLDTHVSFVLGDDLVIRKLKFLDAVLDQLDAVETHDVYAEMDTQFALMSAEVRRIFHFVTTHFKCGVSTPVAAEIEECQLA